MILVVTLAVLLVAPWGGVWPALDIAALIAGPTAAISLIACAWFVVRGGWSTRLFGFVAAVPGISILWPPSEIARCVGPHDLRVAWLNAHEPHDPTQIDAWLLKENPDVIGLAEVGMGSAALRDRLEPRYPYWVSCLRNGRCSTLIFSRQPTMDTRSLGRGDPEKRESLSATLVKVRWAGSSAPATIVALHLSRPLPIGRQQRELAEIDAVLGVPSDAIVMGDFNMSPRMRSLRDFAARNGLQVVALDGPTWPVRVADQHVTELWQIDHLLLGGGWRVKAFRRSPDVGSDHRGFVADLCRTDP